MACSVVHRPWSNSAASKKDGFASPLFQRCDCVMRPARSGAHSQCGLGEVLLQQSLEAPHKAWVALASIGCVRCLCV